MCNRAVKWATVKNKQTNKTNSEGRHEPRHNLGSFSGCKKSERALLWFTARGSEKEKTSRRRNPTDSSLLMKDGKEEIKNKLWRRWWRQWSVAWSSWRPFKQITAHSRNGNVVYYGIPQPAFSSKDKTPTSHSISTGATRYELQNLALNKHLDFGQNQEETGWKGKIIQHLVADRLAQS